LKTLDLEVYLELSSFSFNGIFSDSLMEFSGKLEIIIYSSWLFRSWFFFFKLFSI